MQTRATAALVFLFSLALLQSACKDPSQDVPSAEVSDPAESAENEESADESAEAAEGEEAADEEAPASENLVLGPDNTTIAFVGSKVTGSHEGQFQEFAGTLELKPGDVAGSIVDVTIQTASVVTDNERLTGHLKSDDFFDVAQFPTARFTSTRIEEGGEGDATHTITGNFTLHGETKTIRFPATVDVTDASVSLAAEFSINRRDFGIVYDGRPDDLIRDGVVIKLELSVPRG